MREKLFILWVWALGVTLAGTLVYGLVNFPPNTITQHMINHVEYRIIITVCVVLQSVLWLWCVWSKRLQDYALAIYAYMFITIIIISWIVLSTILTTEVHIIFVYICMGSLFFFIATLAQITVHENAVYILYFSLLTMLATGIAMIILFAKGSDFFIPEHIAFLAYDAVFVLFFTVHTYAYWDQDERINKELSIYSSDWQTEEEEEEISGTFYAGRGGLVWIPAWHC